MRRLFGALAAFTGWLCVPLAGALGFATGGFARPDAFGELPADSVYGLPAIVVFWFFLFAAIVAAMAFLSAFYSPDPSRALFAGAAALACLGVVLLPDALGRSFGVMLLPGAGLLAAAGQLVRPVPGPAAAVADGAAGAGVTAPGVEATAELVAPDTATGGVPAPRAAAIADAGETIGPVAVRLVETDELAQPPEPPTPSPASPVERDPAVDARRPEPAPAPSAPEASGAAGGAIPVAAAPFAPACQWCSTPVPLGAPSCPSCGASLADGGEGEEVSIAGLTAVQPELRSYAERVAVARRSEPAGRRNRGLLAWLNSLEEPYGVLERDAEAGAASPAGGVPFPADADALKPPSAEVRAEMARIEREARRLRERAEAAASAVPEGPVADEAPVAGQDCTGRGVDEPAMAESGTTVPAGEPPDSDATAVSGAGVPARPRRRRRGA